MRFLLFTWALLGATVAFGARAAFSFEDQRVLAGRWELTSIEMPIAKQRGKYVVIDNGTIKVKRDCNEIMLSYSIKGDELSATPITTTLLACHLPNRFADEDRFVYQAVLHSRYQINGDVLRLFSLKDSPFDYSLAFHRAQ
jgi:heat shock protein HslJ